MCYVLCVMCCVLCFMGYVLCVIIYELCVIKRWPTLLSTDREGAEGLSANSPAGGRGLGEVFDKYICHKKI